MELPPRRLRGLSVMAPRHIYNPTILRGRGRFPVRLFSLLGREAALLPQCSQRYWKSETPKHKQREVEGAVLLGDLVTCSPAFQTLRWVTKKNFQTKSKLQLNQTSTAKTMSNQNKLRSVKAFYSFSYSQSCNRCYTVEYFRH